MQHNKNQDSIGNSHITCFIEVNTQFLFLCGPQKSGFLRTYTLFPGITQKIQTTETFHLLELIIEIVSFLQTSSLKDVLQL